MKIVIDNHNILSIQYPEINETKEYCYNLDWFEFCDFNKWIIVYHKNNSKSSIWEICEIKCEFYGMTKDEELENIELNLESVEHAQNYLVDLMKTPDINTFWQNTVKIR